MKKITLLLITVLAISTMAWSQTTKNPWALGIGTNHPDFKGAAYSIGDYLTDAYWQYKGIPLRISAARNLSKSFNLETSFNMVKLDNTGFTITDDKFWDWDLNLQYKLANGYILKKEDTKIDPYLFIGGELTHYNGVSYGAAMGGFGFNAWLTEKFGLYAQAAYDYVPDGDNYYHFGFGLKYRFGMKDKDKDGIADKEDACPETPGIEQFKGCPDTDKDGIQDKEDECPTVAGKPELKGCPDKDGDGIADKNDACPEVAGLAALNGCPDKDGDGIADKDDKCPDVKGLPALKGCPDKDGDGVADKDDNCPEVAGPASNKGCPVEVEKPKFTFAPVIVYFESNSAKLTDKYKAVLDAAIAAMGGKADSEYFVNGYADSQGPDAYNMKLSEKRTKAVVDYLKAKGLDVKRFDPKAYGEASPAATNDTAEGRAQNRRCEIILK